MYEDHNAKNNLQWNNMQFWSENMNIHIDHK